MIVSGLLTGIPASRVVSGIIGEYLGMAVHFQVADDRMMCHHHQRNYLTCCVISKADTVI